MNVTHLQVFFFSLLNYSEASSPVFPSYGAHQHVKKCLFIVQFEKSMNYSNHCG